MSRRATGVAFIAIAAFLFAAHYLAAAILGSQVRSWDEDLYGAMLAYIGPELPLLSAAFLLAGLVYLVLAERSTEPR